MRSSAAMRSEMFSNSSTDLASREEIEASKYCPEGLQIKTLPLDRVSISTCMRRAAAWGRVPVSSACSKSS
ncbi:hypothetical protein D9M68_947590 [compost metagenome]